MNVSPGCVHLDDLFPFYSRVTIQRVGGPWMAQAIQVESCNQCRGIHRVVDNRFCHMQQKVPIRERVDVSLRYFVKRAVDAFCLTIRLLMVRSLHNQTCPERSEHGPPELRRKVGLSFNNEFHVAFYEVEIWYHLIQGHSLPL